LNWLAHTLLSRPDNEFRLGNLLADLVKRPERDEMSAAFLQGVRCHQTIDAYTDSHPIVHRSWQRIADEHRRYAGILVDIFYDHFLACNWGLYASESFEVFIAGVYTMADSCEINLPGPARAALQHIVQTDRFGAYRHIDGIEETLRRLGRRLTSRFGRPIRLNPAVEDLTAHYDSFAGDFAEFFPMLQLRVNRWLAGTHQPAPASD